MGDWRERDETGIIERNPMGILAAGRPKALALTRSPLSLEAASEAFAGEFCFVGCSEYNCKNKESRENLGYR